MLASLILIGGYRGVVERYEDALLKSSATSRALQARIVANDSTIARAALLRDTERRARSDLAHMSRENRLPGSTAELLDHLQDVGRAFGVRVVSVAPQHETATGAPPQQNLIATPVAIEAQGEFGPMLRFIQELPRRRTLVGIDSAQLAVSRSSVRPSAQLSATIHATLYRLLLDNVFRD
jgi:Tfp pilus assembly protein PilO